MKIEIVQGKETILREIADKSLKQRDVAQTYRLIMESSECATTDWKAINIAIIERWSVAGLKAIKAAAHSGSCFN